MHFTHLALAVLVMDLCFNRDEAGENERKVEVKVALQMLESAGNPSPLLNRSLSSLREVLERHEVHLPDWPPSPNFRVAGLPETEPNGSGPFSNVQMQSAQLGLDTFLDDSLDASFDEAWQGAIQSEANLDLSTWDNLFSALDSRPF